MRQMSRYLFLEYMEDFSMVLVANQGSYDLHFFMLRKQVGAERVEFKLERQYIFKANGFQIRILGVSIVRISPHKSRVYVLTSDLRMNVLSVEKKHRKLIFNDLVL